MRTGIRLRTELRQGKAAVSAVLALTLLGAACRAAPTAEPGGEEAAESAAQGIGCNDVTIRFFAGGDEGDAFASIVLRGAQQADQDLGPNVDYVFSGWAVERMTSQLRDAIATGPDVIAMMGHPGDDAIMPLAEEAAAAGIVMMYQNVDVPEVRARFGGGYVGADQVAQGRALGEKALELFDLQEGDFVIAFGGWGQPGRFIREEATAAAWEEAGLEVERITVDPATAGDPSLLTPVVTGALERQPDTKLILYPGGQQLGAVPQYMEAAGKAPGEIIAIGFDLNPAVIDGFEQGYVQLTADQQPWLQGYLPILSLCGTLKYGLSPLNVDTGAGFVTEENFQEVIPLVEQGIR